MKADFKPRARKRPWRSRIWVHGPDWTWDWLWIKAWAWKPFSKGADEFSWHTWTIGFVWLFQVVIAVRPCPVRGCFTEEEIVKFWEQGYNLTPEWPVDAYGWDHTKSDLENAWLHPETYPTPEEVYADYPEEWDAYHRRWCANPQCTHVPGSKFR